MFILGLTGSIGMGKSTAAQVLRDHGVPVHDADAVVHQFLAPGGAAADQVRQAFPEAVADGTVDRQALGRIVFADDTELQQLEAILHPLVRQSEGRFVADQRAAGADLVVLDIPLLFETGAQNRVDAVLLVTAPEDVQRERVLSRPGMTETRFQQIKARQTPDAEKRQLAQHIVLTDQPHAITAQQIRDIADELRDLGARNRSGHGDDGTRPKQR